MSFPDPMRSVRPLIRTKTAADWTAGDYYLSVGELGVESDTGNLKIGVGDKVRKLKSEAWTRKERRPACRR